MIAMNLVCFVCFTCTGVQYQQLRGNDSHQYSFICRIALRNVFMIVREERNFGNPCKILPIKFPLIFVGLLQTKADWLGWLVGWFGKWTGD